MEGSVGAIFVICGDEMPCSLTHATCLKLLTSVVLIHFTNKSNVVIFHDDSLTL